VYKSSNFNIYFPHFWQLKASKITFFLKFWIVLFGKKLLVKKTLHMSLSPTHLYRVWKFNFGERKGYGSVVIVGTSWRTKWELKKQVGDTFWRMWWEYIGNMEGMHCELDVNTSKSRSGNLLETSIFRDPNFPNL
jgi:hypothetical protein